MQGISPVAVTYVAPYRRETSTLEFALRRAVCEAPPTAACQIKKPPFQVAFYFGGAGGNRTPVRKSSTDSSTYLASLFDLT